MTTEEKELLLKDLTARLQYGVHVKRIVHTTPTDAIISVELFGIYWLKEFYANECELKPYLRPMSSMTDEEKLDYVALGDILRYGKPQYAYLISEQLDYLNINHFDYRGLIEKGLALEAPEGMYD